MANHGAGRVFLKDYGGNLKQERELLEYYNGGHESLLYYSGNIRWRANFSKITM